MAFAKARALSLVVGMTWTTIWIASFMPNEIICTYDHNLLMTYARLSQQLRQEMRSLLLAFQARVEETDVRVVQKRTEVQEIIKYSSALYGVRQRIDALLSDSNRNAAFVVTAFPDGLYEDITACPLSRTLNDYSMGWQAESCTVDVVKGGVYVLEAKLQSLDYGAYKIDVKVLDADGEQKNAYAFITDWEVTPMFQLLRLEPGDSVVIPPWDETNFAYITPAKMRKGFRTQLTLRFLGNFVPMEFTTEAPSTAAVNINPFPMPGPFPIALG